MKPILAAILVAVASGSPEIRYFQYQRSLQNTPQHPVQTCVVLDAELLANAAPQLADLRLYHDNQETPYFIHLPAPELQTNKSISPLNLGIRAGETNFDVSMPGGRYSDIELELSAQDFIATATVFGVQRQGDSLRTKLGSYTIFDLTHQRLGRSTILHLPESDFRSLHFQISGPVPPETVRGILIEPLATSEPEYETVAVSSGTLQKNNSSVFELTVLAHVPVDRLVFTLGKEPVNFSREVTVAAAAAPAPDGEGPPRLASSKGNLLRIHKVQNDHRIDEEQLAIAAPAVNSDLPTNWTVSIENGDDAPLQVESIRLQMLQRRLCFESTGEGQYIFMFGDPALKAPRYDYSALFAPQSDAVVAGLGASQRNPAYQVRPDLRPLSERHPALLWTALIIVIALLGGIALRSTKGEFPAQ